MPATSVYRAVGIDTRWAEALEINAAYDQLQHIFTLF